MHKKFEIYRTKIKGSCQSVRKVVTQDSKSNLPLILLGLRLAAAGRQFGVDLISQLHVSGEI